MGISRSPHLGISRNLGPQNGSKPREVIRRDKKSKKSPLFSFNNLIDIINFGKKNNDNYNIGTNIEMKDNNESQLH